MRIRAKMLLLLIIMLLFTQGSYAKMIEVEGLGKASLDGNVYNRKQAAYIAALADAMNNLGEQSVNLAKDTEAKYDIKQKSNKLLGNSNWKIGKVTGKAQTIINDYNLELYLINIDYDGQAITVKDYSLVTPSEFISFPRWDSQMKEFSGITIIDVKWLPSDINSPYGYCSIKIKGDSSIIKSNSSKQRDANFISFKFLKDINGQYTYNRVTVTGFAFGGGSDTPDIVRQKALEQAMRNAVEQVNGVAIKSVTEVQNATLKKDDIITQTLGVAKVIEKSFTPKFNSEGSFQVECLLTADVPVIELVSTHE